MRRNTFGVLLASSIVLASCSHSGTDNHGPGHKSAAGMFSEIKHFLPSVGQVPSPSLTVEGISGRYCTHGPSLAGRLAPALSGSELYLFPGSTYIYLEWADVLPLTVHGRGRTC